VTVLIHRRVPIDNVEVGLKIYQPSGRLSKGERERADRLDKALSVRIPALAQEVVIMAPEPHNFIRRWYVLGQKLRAIVEDRELVSSSDVSSGLLWQAIWYYLPDALKPANSGDTDVYSGTQHKRKDHLSLCYEISGFDWNEVRWIQRWDDWHQLAFRPGLLRDPRILRALGKAISALASYPTRETFRNIVKRLGEAFPTRHHRDSSLLSNDVIEKTVAHALSEPSFNRGNHTQQGNRAPKNAVRGNRSA